MLNKILFISLLCVASVFCYVCQECDGDMCCNIPSNNQYYLTDFCGTPGTTSCGYSCSAMTYFTADRQRFGCNTYLNLCGRGKCVKAKVIDAGPADWVEKDAGMPIIDASVPTCEYFTGGKSCGWSDRILITAVRTTVKDDSELGPFNVTEEEYNKIVSEGQLLYDEWVKKQTPKANPCCSPDQWEGYQFSFDEREHFRAGLNVSYDYTNKRLRVLIEERTPNNKKKILEAISLYNNNTMYLIDHTSNTCTSEQLNESMIQDCVPKDAVLETSPVLGGSLKTNLYRFSRTDHDEDVDFIEVRTQDNCFPVDVFAASNRFGVDENFFWDIALGIKDPSVFNIPPICKKTNSDDVDHPMLPRLLKTTRAVARGKHKL